MNIDEALALGANRCEIYGVWVEFFRTDAPIGERWCGANDAAKNYAATFRNEYNRIFRNEATR